MRRPHPPFAPSTSRAPSRLRMGYVTDRICLMGVAFDRVDETQAIGAVVAALDAGRGGSLMTVNVDILRQLLQSDSSARLLANAELVVADGMPLVWASRLKGTSLPARVAGSDLVWSLTAECALRGRSVFLLGGTPGAGEAAARRLRECYPGLEIAGCYSPPFGFEKDPAETEHIRRLVRDAAPDLVHVGLGFPKQERLIAQLRTELPSAWFAGVGVSFSFVSGTIARAPDALMRVGLEWMHRLVQEPRRLARRYLVDDLPFAARLLAHSIACRLRGRELATPYVRRPAPLPLSHPRVVFGRGSDERHRAEDLAALTAHDRAICDPERAEQRLAPPPATPDMERRIQADTTPL